MLRIVVAVVVVAVVWGQDENHSEKKYCCSPAKWEGIQAGQGGLIVAGKPQVLASVSRVSFDRNRRRVFAFTNTTSGLNKFVMKTYQDFKSGYQFTVDVMKQTCTKSKIPWSFADGCVPDSARFNGKFKIGVGPESVLMKSYNVHVQSGTSVMDIALSVTDKTCVPIGENIVGSCFNVPLAVTYGFVDITPGIRDPSVFNPPAICKQNTTVEFPPNHIDSHFSILHV